MQILEYFSCPFCCLGENSYTFFCLTDLFPYNLKLNSHGGAKYYIICTTLLQYTMLFLPNVFNYHANIRLLKAEYFGDYIRRSGFINNFLFLVSSLLPSSA